MLRPSIWQIMALAYVCLILVGVSSISSSFDIREANPGELIEALPEGCRLGQPTLELAVAGADQEWQNGFWCGDSYFETHIFRFNVQKPGKEATSSVHETYQKTGRVQPRSYAGKQGVILETEQGVRFYTEWYQIGSHTTQNVILTKLREVVSTITQGQPQAVSRVVLSVLDQRGNNTDQTMEKTTQQAIDWVTNQYKDQSR